MNATAKVIKYELNDVARSKWVIAYALFFFFLTEGLFRFGNGSTQVLISLMQVVLLITPLISLIFGTVYVYNARDFLELLLTQPVHRKHLFSGLYIGLALPLSVGFLVGILVPFALLGVDASTSYGTLFMMAVSGVALTFIFVMLALLIALRFNDKVKGLGGALLLLLFFAVLYDALLLFIVHAFAEYPLETPMLFLTLLNPIDLVRVLMLLNFDTAALMGYTGAVFESFFGSALGMGIASVALACWVGLPYWLGFRLFLRKDF